MAYSKIFRRYVRGLISLAALVFCACAQLPEYCGDGQSSFDTKNQFCYGGAAYWKCGGKTYDPIHYKCNDNGQIVAKTDTVPTVTPPVTPATYLVTVSSAGANHSGTGSYEAGVTVTISAGTAPSGQQFKNWTTASAGVTLANANSSTTTFTMPKNAVTVTANFEQIPVATYTVTVSSAGTGATGGGSYAVGATVSINAGTPPTNQKFKNWSTTSAGVTFANSNSAATTFTMPSNAVAVTANFEAATVSPPDVSYVTFTDSRDNQNYNAVKIGNQTWMAENLNYATKAGEGNSWCYGDDNSNCNQYGRLYDWSTAMAGSPSSNRNPSGVRGVCPANWHLPSRAEWTALVDYAGGYYNAGTKLKSKTGWKVDYGTDDFGFSALPGGYRDTNTDGGFGGAGIYGDWWTATEYGSGNAYDLGMECTDGYVSGGNEYRSNGHSVRCVQD